MRKVLLVTPELEYTGAVQSFRRMCKVLKENGYDVHALSYKNGPFAQEIEKIDVKLSILDADKVGENKLEKFLKSYDLIIANTIETYRIADVGQKIGRPTIWYVREADNLPEFFEKNKKRQEAFERARNIYVVSEYARDFIVNNFNENVRVLHNCVEDERLLYNFENTRRDNDKVKFLALGTIEERKGYDVYIDAYLDMQEEVRKKCEIHYAGRLLDWAKWFYEPLLQKTKGVNGVVYHGTVNERKELMQLVYDCDCVVVPSRDESCSLVVLEAAMMGKPIIVTENIGAKYLVTPSCGWIIKTGSKDALKKVYEEIVRNPHQLKIMGEVARKRYEETSTYQIYTKNLLNVVEDNILHHYIGNGKTTIQEYLNIECSPKLYSFDVFDTLITRNVACPTGIFTIMQNELCSNDEYSNVPDYIKNDFASLRKEAEKRARSMCGANKCEDITLDDIYSVLLQNGMSQENARRIRQLEVLTEKRNIVPISSNIQKVKKLISEGQDVILISDMYLPTDVVREFLTPYGECFSDIDIYVSCQYKKCKRTGNLYRIVRRNKDIAFHEWVHYGDNPINDVESAKKLGIHGELLGYPKLYDYENKLNSGVEGYAQLVFGTCRNIRINVSQTLNESIGSCIAGIILYPYMTWVLNNAISQGIEKLYFVARDGYILKWMADIMISANKLPLETEYLYGSRKAWRLPALTSNIDYISIKELVDVSNNNYITSLDLLASVLQVSKEVICEYSATSKAFLVGKFGYSDLYQIVSELDSSREFCKILYETFSKQRENCVGYLRQSIGFDKKFGFVELSGSGFTQYCLKLLLDTIHKDTYVKSFYYVCKPKKIYRQCDNYSFLQRELKYSYVVELFARSLENQTIGYEIRDNIYYPIFEGTDKKRLEQYHYDEYLAGAMLFCEKFIAVMKNNPYVGLNMRYLMNSAEQIFNGNHDKIFDFIADMPFDNTGFRKTSHRFAPKLTNEEIRNIYFLHSEKEANQYYSGNEYGLSKKRLTKEQWDTIKKYEKDRNKITGQFRRGVFLIQEHGFNYSTRYILKRLKQNLLK